RAMAAYGAYLSVCGYEYHGPRGYLAFGPRLSAENFRCAFTSAEGWGRYGQRTADRRFQAELCVLGGKLRLNMLGFVPPASLRGHRVSVSVSGKNVRAGIERANGKTLVSFNEPIILSSGDRLELVLEP
ncbi:MAG: glucosylceramidase, partial [Verrucomicrobiae bacterium]|nr:glucosylceramidase [Verrucomicrobiae bacterium]